MESVRSGEDVWREIQHKCRQLMASATPLLTLEREVPNVITDVTDTAIWRRSAEARTPEDSSAVPKSDVLALWHSLQERGVASDAAPLRFAYALLARLIDGVEFKSDPYRIVMAGPDQATQPFQASGGGVNDEAQHLSSRGSSSVSSTTR